MRITSEHTDQAWRSPVKDGPTRPVVRATIEKLAIRSFWYNTQNAPGGDYDHERSRRGQFRSALFGGRLGIREVRNIKKFSWQRSVDQDVAEATMTILNTDVTPLGNAEEQSGDYELPGLFTFSRGDQTISANRWGYSSETGWNAQLVPDRLIKTYEGYGSSDEVPPGDDENLYISGTWVPDEVGYAADGNIEIQMRDLGRVLIDHIAFLPIVPRDDYPMMWSKIRSDQVEGRDAIGGEWAQPAATATSSNNLYVGEGIVDKPRYVGPSGGVQGHQNNHPIRGDDEDWWLSTGQEGPDSVVWWEEEFTTPQAIAAIRPHTVGGPYRIFISLQRSDGVWYGKKKIPYTVTTEGVDLEAGIKYVDSAIAERGEPFDITLKRRYPDVKKVRITFTRLRRMIGGTYPWRAALRKLSVYRADDVADLSFGPGEVLTPVGNYSDFTDIVKWVCAWAGFWWPDTDAANFINYETSGTDVHYDYAVGDPILPRGRVWGSFQNTGTAGQADLTADNFDKQPLLDCISHIREITGFLFAIDEAGGPIWRMPNLFSLGNYVTPHHKLPRRAPARTNDVIVIDENETLIEYTTRLSSRNMREHVFVGDSNGKYGTVVRGYVPYETGLRRVAGWTDQNFKSNREARVAADMVVARQMFDFRRSKVKIWGNPAIQIDDQTRIFERVTNETFYHYVLGISSTLDMDQGTWDYDLETHWLGERPSDAWVVRVDQLDGATQAYMETLGAVD